MRVALADDSTLFREGLHRLLTDLGVDVLHTASTGHELLARTSEQPPDLAILDIRMPPTFTDEGLVTAKTLQARHPGIGVLLLSTYAESPYAASLLADGASKVGYLLKDRVDDPEALLDALHRLDQGESVIDADLVSQLIHHERHLRDVDRLSEREREVLQHMAEGRSNAGIAKHMYVSNKTVENHVTSLFTKLDLPPLGDDNRRVMAVLTWLRVQSAPRPV